MGILDDIEKFEKTVKTKKDIIIEHQEEIQIMLNKGISKKEQINLLIKNNILDYISESHYCEILKNFTKEKELQTISRKKNTSSIKKEKSKIKDTSVMRQSVKLEF